MPRDLTGLLARSVARTARDERGVVTAEETILIVCVLVACVFAWTLLGDVIYGILSGE